MAGQSLNEEVSLCINLGVTPTELLVMRLIFLAVDGDVKLLANFATNTNIDIREVLQSLQKKGVILANYRIPEKGEVLKVENIPFNKTKIKTYLRESHQAGMELFDAYPMFINKTIKLSGATHERVMNAVEFGKEKNLINYSIFEFIASRKWEEIEYIQSSGNVNGYVNSELL